MKLSRLVTFAPGAVLGWWGWDQLGHPGHAAGLVVLAALALIIWPLAVLFLVFGIPAALMAVIPPRPCRKWWRQREPGLAEACLHWVVRSPVGRDGAKSAYIPKWLKNVIYAADRRRCVACGRGPADGVRLNVDHVMPWSLGGLTALFNMMTLCWPCNRAKSNAWIFNGRFWASRTCDPVRAEAILRVQLEHRYGPARLLRAVWALGA